MGTHFSFLFSIYSENHGVQAEQLNFSRSSDITYVVWASNNESIQELQGINKGNPIIGRCYFGFQQCYTTHTTLLPPLISRRLSVCQSSWHGIYTMCVPSHMQSSASRGRHTLSTEVEGRQETYG